MHYLLTAVFLTGFLMLDQSMPLTSTATRWAIFFPLELLRLVGEQAPLAVDYQILLLIFVGLPLLLTYWFSAYRFLCGRDPEPGRPESAQPTSQQTRVSPAREVKRVSTRRGLRFYWARKR